MKNWRLSSRRRDGRVARRVVATDESRDESSRRTSREMSRRDGRVACVAASHDATKLSPILHESQRSISSHVFITSHTIIGSTYKLCHTAYDIYNILNNNNCYYYILIHITHAYMAPTCIRHIYSYIHTYSQ